MISPNPKGRRKYILPPSRVGARAENIFLKTFDLFNNSFTFVILNPVGNLSNGVKNQTL